MAADAVVLRPIVGYHQDDQRFWVAELECGHFQHVRHDPPWMNRAWVTTELGRQTMLGYTLDCAKCRDGAPPDQIDETTREGG
ncbi:MAG: DUF3565 domain-containing protein [Rubripirellula sp.]